jgi:hypothetical protein
MKLSVAPLSSSTRRMLGRILLGVLALALLLLWANSRILALRERQDPARPLVLSGYYVFHAMAAALEEGRIGQLDLTRYHEYTAADQPLAPYRPQARQGEPEYVHYYTLDVGYSFIVELARLLFRSLPDNYYRALALQLVVDFVTVVLVWRLFSEWGGWLGPLASSLFVANRVFLDLVSFAYYYYYDVPMTLLLLGTLLLAARRPDEATVWVALGGAALGFGVWLRASWWPLGFAYFAALFLFRPLRRKLLVALLPFAIFAVPQIVRSSMARGELTLSTRATWHVALVGLGYYPNPYGLDAKDETVFDLTARKYGVRFRFEDYSGEHNDAARREYMELLKRDPRFVIASVLGRLRESLLGTTRDSLAPYPVLGNIGYRVLCALGLLLMIRRGEDRRLVGLATAFAYLTYVGVTSLFYFVGLSYDSVSQAALLVLLIGLFDSIADVARQAGDRSASARLSAQD